MPSEGPLLNLIHVGGAGGLPDLELEEALGCPEGHFEIKLVSEEEGEAGVYKHFLGLGRAELAGWALGLPVKVLYRVAILWGGREREGGREGRGFSIVKRFHQVSRNTLGNPPRQRSSPLSLMRRTEAPRASSCGSQSQYQVGRRRPEGFEPCCPHRSTNIRRCGFENGVGWEKDGLKWEWGEGKSL